MKANLFVLLLQVLVSTVAGQPSHYKNTWTKAPVHIPNDVAIDAPLMGNGDVTMSVGYTGNCLRYYLGKNDFWRLRSQAENLSGPRVAAFFNIKIAGFDGAGFSAGQSLSNGITTCRLTKNSQVITAKSWVSATRNLIFVELSALHKPATLSVNLAAPENMRARLSSGKNGETDWLTRSFVDSVDIVTGVAIAARTINYPGLPVILQPGKKLIIALAVESRFKCGKPLDQVINRVKSLTVDSLVTLLAEHNKWWNTYWNKSNLSVGDKVLMKAYYQGLYTMAACSRDPEFPPGLFGWTTVDKPRWNGDYHLNYNFQSAFYALYGANRVRQGEPQDGPLLDFMSRGEWYAKQVTRTRGILYPVGIGPQGIEVTRNFTFEAYQKAGDIEQGGLFFGQRSNAAYGLVNMAQQWRCTYDLAYAKKIYPYALAVANFWEDYLKLENGRYVIYNDAIHEGSGKDKNPILSLGLVRNAFNLIVDLSSALKVDENRQAQWKDILNRISQYPTQIRAGKKVFRYTEEGLDWWNDNGLGIQHIYPANGITLDSSRELLQIARNTIAEMHRWQDVNTSNSFFMAAIRVGFDPDVIFAALHKYALHTYPNGFQSDNPHGIENSCTVANALDEMLCMSVGNVIRLFPALPKKQQAAFTNIRTWGAFLVSAKVMDGLVSNVKIVSEKGGLCTLINPWPNRKISLLRNGKPGETLSGNRISFRTSVNETIRINSGPVPVGADSTGKKTSPGER